MRALIRVNTWPYNRTARALHTRASFESLCSWILPVLPLRDPSTLSRAVTSVCSAEGRERGPVAQQRAEQREERLRKRRERDRARRASQGQQHRETYLQVRRESQAAETEQQRQARLQRTSTAQGERLATETEEERQARLQRMSTAQRERLAAETEEVREARLHDDRERHREHPAVNLQLPLLHQRSVQTKMLKFHEHMATLDVSKCTTCLEQFPGLQLCSRSTECLRCSRDKRTPKLYSLANNMDPGSVPSELQVCVL